MNHGIGGESVTPAPPVRSFPASAFVALMFAAFVETMGSFLVLALLPFYGQRFGATPTTVGWLVATFALAQMLSAPLWGRLSDAIGRKVVLLLGLGITALAYWLFAQADGLVGLFVSRALQGLGAGTVSVVFAFVADVLPSERRAEGIGWVTAATSGAAMIGPVLGSFAARFDASYPGYWSFALAILAIGLVAVLLPSPKRVSARPSGSGKGVAVEKGPGAGRQGSLATALVGVLRAPFSAGPVLVWTYSVGMLATSATFGVIGLFLSSRFGIDEGSIWWFFSLLAGASLVLRVWALGPLVRRFGEARLIVGGAAFLGVATLLMAAPTSAVWLVVPIVLFALGQSLLYPCATARLSTFAEREGSGLLGQAIGVQQAYGGVSKVVGPVAGGWAFAQIGPEAPFVACGLLVVVWAVVVRMVLRREQLGLG